MAAHPDRPAVVDECARVLRPGGVLADRLNMYRTLHDTTVARSGETPFQAWDRT